DWVRAKDLRLHSDSRYLRVERAATVDASLPPLRPTLAQHKLDRAELLLGDLQQLPLGLEARALDRLAQLDPLRVVDFAELRRECAAGVLHQIEVHPFANQRVTGAEEILDRVQRLHDLRLQSGLLQHLAQRGAL